ncbi:MAG: GerMN domain-containing protein [Bacillota bacterium]|nr:GerMN domain-containing protein [Bacillota bacterium]
MSRMRGFGMQGRFIVITAVIALLVSGCSLGAGASTPPAAKPGQPSTPPSQPNVAMPGASITPMSPGVSGDEAIASRQVQIRAKIDLPAATKLARLVVKLDGSEIGRQVYKLSGFGDGLVLLVRAYRDVPDGAHEVLVRAEDTSGRSVEKKWSFSVAALMRTLPAFDTTALTLYFADTPAVVTGVTGEWGYVTPVKRLVAKTTQPALKAIEELIAGPRPEDSEVGSVIPKTSKVLGVWIKDRVAFVNLNREFQEKHPGGTLGGSVTAGSIVLTMTEFPSVDKVQILVEGKPWSDGHFEFTEPWPRPAKTTLAPFTVP